MIDDIYSQKILQFAGNISRIGILENADAVVQKTARLCGSKLTVYLKVENGIVVDFSQEVRACALGQASAAIMALHVIGADHDEIFAARAAMQAMLKGEGEGPSGRFGEARILLPVKDFSSRHGSVMLAFDATAEAIDDCMRKAVGQTTVSGGF